MRKNINWRHLLIPTLIGVLFSLFVIFLTRFSAPSGIAWHTMIFFILSLIIIWNVLRMLVFNRLSKENERRNWRLFSLLVQGGLVAIVIFDLFYVVIKSLDRILYGLYDPLQVGHIIASSGVGFLCVLIVGGIQTGYYFMRQSALSNLEAEVARREALQTRLHSLRQQLDPHFLFNSFSTLDSLIYTDQNRASEFLHKLSTFYHRTLESFNKDLISLAEEMSILRTYTDLLTIRFAEAVRFEMNIDESLLSYKIPPLALQLLLENCIKHNVVNQEQALVIEVYTQDEYVVVSNPKRPKNVVRPSGKVGLSNLIKRFELLGKTIRIADTRERFEVKLELIA